MQHIQQVDSQHESLVERFKHEKYRHIGSILMENTLYIVFLFSLPKLQNFKNWATA